MKFSVLMSVYKKEQPQYLRQALSSVIEQTKQPDEIILMEDGILTEELYQVIQNAKEEYPYIKDIQIEKNIQLGRSLARGLEVASYEWVARMDTDDIAKKDRFDKQCSFIEQHPECSVVGGFMEEFSDDAAWNKVKKVPVTIESIREYARYRNPMNHMTVMMKKEDVLNAGNYQHVPGLEDYDLWSRMLQKGYILCNIPEVLVEARTNSSIYERRGGFAYCREYLRLRKRQKQLGLIKGMVYWKACMLSIMITLQPAGLRKLIYQKILRK